MIKFPRTFCVTLKETPLRTKAFLEEAKKAGIDAELFNGVYGPRLRLTPKLPNELECPDQNVFLTDGAVGCYLSHFILWNVLQYLPEEEFLIIEDDAFFVDGFMEKFKQIYDRLPSDWELIYVGWLPYAENIKNLVVDNGLSIRFPAATHGYLIKKSFLQTAIDAIQPCSSPIDLMIRTKVLPRVKFYVMDPPLIEQRSFENSNDFVWNSLVYDWKSDLYGSKKQLLKNLSLISGWHNLEQNDGHFWRWSDAQATIRVPSNLASFTLVCTTPMDLDNTLIITYDDKKIEIDLTSGENIINVPSNGYEKFHLTITSPFIPSERDKESRDSRKLGVCLRKILLNTGTYEFEVPLNEVLMTKEFPINFKLKL